MDAVFDDIFGNSVEIVDPFDFDMDLLLDNGSAASPPDDDMLMSAIMENNLLGLPEGGDHGVELEWDDKLDMTNPSSRGEVGVRLRERQGGHLGGAKAEDHRGGHDHQPRLDPF